MYLEWYEALIASVIIPVGVVMLFWSVIFIRWAPLFFAAPMNEETIEERNRRREEEAVKIENDMKRIKIPHFSIDKERFETKREEFLANMGVSENDTISQEDARDAYEGDSWLCNGRPFWFGVIQVGLILPWFMPLMVILSLFTPLIIVVPVCFTIALIAFVFITVWIGFSCYVQIEEGTRGAVRIWGALRTGFLSAGLHFVLPWGIEKVFLVSLQYEVWGPENAEAKGSLGTPANPSPGKVVIQLYSQFEAVVNVSILYRTRGDKASWAENQVSFESDEEIGQQIATLVTPILTSRAREVSDPAALNLQSKQPDQVAEAAMNAFLNLIKQVPEIITAIHMTLIKTNKMAGLIIVSARLSDIQPGSDFRKMLQGVYESWIDQAKKSLQGTAQANYLKSLREFIRDADTGVGVTDPQQIMAAILELERLRTLGQFPKGGNSLADSLTAWLAQKTTNEK